SWTVASAEFQASEIRTGHTIVALVANEDLHRALLEISKEFQKLALDTLRAEMPAIVRSSSEQGSAAHAAGETRPAGAAGKTTNLDKYTIDLTERAREGKIDPVLGRDGEVRQVIDILTRRRQNNPILVGEAGVGKTAIVE